MHSSISTQTLNIHLSLLVGMVSAVVEITPGSHWTLDTWMHSLFLHWCCQFWQVFCLYQILQKRFSKWNNNNKVNNIPEGLQICTTFTITLSYLDSRHFDFLRFRNSWMNFIIVCWWKALLALLLAREGVNNKQWGLTVKRDSRQL